MIVFLESDKNNFTTYLNPPIKARKVRLVSWIIEDANTRAIKK